MNKTHQKEIEAVFKAHYREFCLLSYSYVACMDQAQDIVQDVFVKLLMKDNLSTIVNLKPYIWSSVKNSSLKHAARVKELESLEQSALVIIEDDETWRRELDFSVRKAMDKLPPQCKHVFELCVIDGLKYSSAADSLGISVNTVKTQMKKAFRILRHDLKDVYLILVVAIIKSLH